jgi:hypothetical protein
VDSDATPWLLLFGCVVGLVIFYFIVKAAVRNGVLEAQAVQARQRVSARKEPAVERQSLA